MNIVIVSHSGRLLPAIMVVWLVCLVELRAEEQAAETVRIMSFNLWHGGDAGRQPLEQTLAVIRAARAEIVGLQETAGIAPEGEPRPDRAAQIAKHLGWNYFDQGGGTGIISRHKILNATRKKWGVKLELASGRPLYAFNVHLAPSPYQPYQLLKIPYGEAEFLTTETEAIEAARATRGTTVAEMLSEVRAVVPKHVPVVITGDFNEPSHLDWTRAAVRAKTCPLNVKWPTTQAVALAGFADAYRSVHPDPVKHHGLTWTPTTKITDPNDRHDRIDFVFVGQLDSSNFLVTSAATIGESQEFADIVVTPYPSDHRAVVAEVEFGPSKPARKTSAP